MTTQLSGVRQNYWAIAVAAIACFLFEAGWYTIFMQQWLEGIGRTVNGWRAPQATTQQCNSAPLLSPPR